MTDLNDEKKLLKVRDVIYLGKGMEMMDPRNGKIFRIGDCGDGPFNQDVIGAGCTSGLYFIYEVKLKGIGGGASQWDMGGSIWYIYCAKMDNFNATCTFVQERGGNPYHEGIPAVGVFSERVLAEIMKRVNNVDGDKEQEAP